jgi:DNA-binding MarR family transcriptional regulator
MDIQSDIKQSHFKSPQQKVHINLIYTYNYISNQMRNIFRSHNILYQHFNVLKILKGAGGRALCNNEILDVMLDKTRDLTRLVDKLESMGWVTKQINPINKRSVMIKLTEEGNKFTVSMEKKIEEWMMVNTNLTNEECDHLSILLDKIRG